MCKLGDFVVFLKNVLFGFEFVDMGMVVVCEFKNNLDFVFEFVLV